MGKRNFWALVVALFLWGGCACAFAATPLRVGVYQNMPLLGYDTDGKAKGLFAELLEEVARREGWELTYLPGSLAESLRRLEVGSLDLVPTVAFSAERAEHFAFGEETVFASWGQIVAPEGAGIETILDLDGKRVAVVKKNIHYDGPQGLLRTAEKFALRLSFVECDDFPGVLRAVRDGHADAGLLGRLEGLAGDDLAHLRKTSVLLSPVSIRVAFAKKGDPALVRAFDASLREWKQSEDSIYQQALARWVGGEKRSILPEWLPTALRVMGGGLALLVVVTVFSRVQVRRGLREISQKNHQLETEIDERRQAQNDLQWELKVNRAVAELSRLLLHSSALDEITHVILEEAKSLTDSPHGFVGFIDPRSGAMVCPTMTRDIWEACQVPDKKFVFHSFHGLWGWILKERQPILCNDPTTDYRSTGIPGGHVAIRRFVGVPALADGRLLGIIALANAERDYHAKDLELLERLASMYALAIRTMRATQAMRESEARFRAIFELSGVGIATLSPEGHFLQVNPAYCRFLGYSAEEILHKSVEDVTHPEDLAVTRTLYEEVRQGKRDFFAYDKRFVHRSGRDIWGAVTVAWLLDEEGRPEYAVGMVQDITERKLAELRLAENEERFKHLAHHDNLTGLPNRLLFADRLHHAMSRARRSGALLALLFFDLDRFKAINDTHGHEGGDEVLRAVAQRLTGLVRDADTVARFGGDEFIILMEDVTETTDVEHLAGKVLAGLAQPLPLGDQTLTVTTSIGISIFPRDGADADTLIKRADDAMFRAKQEGRNLFVFHDETPLARVAGP
ncbi:diguanylate cyclase domain-containing protein [Desulfuromonas acetexigens]|uniref:Diguanylate cyclase n=1 Tax=Trichloromonas acetexigens TaxID=38815 RepID=A0A550JGI3_9BACT|nr:diguanylate cyclase [Desulfuromonas acetexigens]TRO82320.1 diguanylate cyclase [Desulfuromonas acetexigens]